MINLHNAIKHDHIQLALTITAANTWALRINLMKFGYDDSCIHFIYTIQFYIISISSDYCCHRQIVLGPLENKINLDLQLTFECIM